MFSRGTIGAVLLILVGYGCATTQSVEPRFDNAASGISFRLPEINNIMELEISSSSSGEKYWIIQRDNLHNLEPTKFSSVNYGCVPAGMNESLSPRKLKPGERIKCVVVYQYDKNLTAHLEKATAEFEVRGPNEFRILN